MVYCRKIFFPVLISLLFLLGCEKEKPKPVTLNKKLEFNKTEYYNSLNKVFKEENLIVLSRDSSFQYLDTLKYFYAARNFEPLFIKSYEEQRFVNSLLILLEKAAEHGLNPEQYHFSLIAREFAKAVNDTTNNPFRLTDLANTELFISDAVLKYAYHMRYGIVDPTKIFYRSYYLPVVDSAKRDLFKPLRQENIIQYLYDIQPKSERYKNLQAALKKFNLYKDIKLEVIPSTDKKIEPGNINTLIKPITERLITYGFLDTTKNKIRDYSFYDSVLVEPVKKFQRLNGLNDDGVIGKSTIEKLNISPHEYISKIKINLERCRWYNYSDTSDYILVNIPAFTLYAIENKKELFHMEVCTGRRRPSNFEKRYENYKKSKKIKDKPDDWETPSFYARISLIVLNPTWNVPPSIIREEIYSEVKKDSNYLAKRNFKVFKDDIEIKQNEIKLTDLKLDDIPYRFVQDPGAGNALGKLKFMFKNPFGIYLHDTPQKAPFRNSNRAVSHGCIRVEKPLILAELLLKGQSKWNLDYLKIEIGMKGVNKAIVAEYQKKRNSLRKNASVGETTEIVLEKKFPLIVDYYTAWTDENGDINFRDDVYNQDKILEEYLIPFIKSR